jgi:hypothetical protein
VIWTSGCKAPAPPPQTPADVTMCTCDEQPWFCPNVSLGLPPLRHRPAQQPGLRVALLEGCSPLLAARVPLRPAVHGIKAAAQRSQECLALRPGRISDHNLQEQHHQQHTQGQLGSGGHTRMGSQLHSGYLAMGGGSNRQQRQ